MPIIVGNFANTLTKVNLNNAKSVVVVTEDEMENLELGLMAHGLSPNSNVIIRTYNRQFSDKVTHLFPYAQVLCTT